jgi:membrane protease subunit HflC
MKVPKFIIPAIVLIGVVYFNLYLLFKKLNQAIVLQFGDPKKIISKAGLNFKLPFIQNVVFLDKRILNLDNEPEEVIAADQKRLIVDAIARFKIVDPLKFYISVGNERVARSRLVNNYKFKNKRCIRYSRISYTYYQQIEQNKCQLFKMM